MSTHDSTSDVLATLFAAPEQVCVVGQGTQASIMRRTVAELLALRIEDLPGTSSREAPTRFRHYLLCASPAAEARETLVARGIHPAKIVEWSTLERTIRSDPDGIVLRHLGLFRSERSIPAGSVGPRATAIESHLVSMANACYDLGYPEHAWSDERLAAFDAMARNYLALRQTWHRQQPNVQRRLLYPSTGRSGGISLTKALSEHPRVSLRVGHETLASPVYRMLRLLLQRRLGESSMALITLQMIDSHDCLGGNPFCFLMPFLHLIPGFEFHLLRVERDRATLRESIIERNFHYTSADFVPERITAVDYGDMSTEAWEKLSISDRVDWYIDRVHAEIDRGTAACTSVVQTELNSLDDGLNTALDRLHWPRLRSIPHINTIPRDRIYSLEERIELYKEEHKKL